MKPQETKRFLVFCEPCAYKKIVTEDELKTLPTIKRADIQGHINELDKQTRKIIKKPPIKKNMLTKCPKCGRGVIVKNLPPSYTSAFDQKDKVSKQTQEEEAWLARLKDGTPEKRKDD